MNRIIDGGVFNFIHKIEPVKDYNAKIESHSFRVSRYIYEKYTDNG